MKSDLETGMLGKYSLRTAICSDLVGHLQWSSKELAKPFAMKYCDQHYIL